MKIEIEDLRTNIKDTKNQVDNSKPNTTLIFIDLKKRRKKLKVYNYHS